VGRCNLAAHELAGRLPNAARRAYSHSACAKRIHLSPFTKDDRVQGQLDVPYQICGNSSSFFSFNRPETQEHFCSVKKISSAKQN